MDSLRDIAGFEVSDRKIRRALIIGGLLVAFALVTTFTVFQWRSESLVREQVLLQAQAFTREIIATRAFVSGHGGIYVPETDVTTVNPFLEDIPGLRTRIFDDTGNSYILQNPALVTRNIAEELAKDDGAEIVFGLTGLTPVNPSNTPDDFQREGLEVFSSGEAEEFYRFERMGERVVFRYLYPLDITLDCMNCHLDYEQLPNNSNRAISIDIDATEVEKDIAIGRTWTIVALIGSLGSLMVVLYLVFTRLFVLLRRTQIKLYDLAVSDELTGLDNRRRGFEKLESELARARRGGSPLAVAMLDIDHFKQVNDMYGHTVGDAVLKAVAHALGENARVYDTVARIGGEEFLILIPEIGIDGAVRIVERIRHAVGLIKITVPGGDTSVTVSAGIMSVACGGDDPTDRIMSLVDEALYAAKAKGRDCVVVRS